MARLEALFDVAVLAPPDTDRVNEARRIVDEGHDKSHTAPAAQRASLRWVATLVARGVAPSGVFEAVAKELGRCLSVDRAAVFRYEPDGKATLVASGGEPRLDKAAVGGRFPAHGENLGRTALLPRGRVTATDINENAGCSADARIRVMGLCLGVGVPIVVGGTVWGGVIAGSSRPQPLPPDSEDRIEDYAVLIAMAIENAAIRAELTASRARVVAAADDARRRLERDLHDGAQQRLVSLALKLRMTEDSLPPGLDAVKEQISHVAAGLTGVFEDLREIARGIHPAIRARGGLGPALETLAGRSAVPVKLDIGVARRLPDYAEVAAYYVMAEALTNTAKHARATQVNVCIYAEDVNLYLSIRDDGIGGADCDSAPDSPA